MGHSLFYRLDNSLHSIPVSKIGIGDLAEVLQNVGLGTLGSLLGRIEIEPRTLRMIVGLRRDDADVIQRKLDALSMVVDDYGFVDWNEFNELPPSSTSPVGEGQSSANSANESFVGAAVPQSPFGPIFPKCDVADGKEFVSSIHEVINAILETRGSETDRLILTGRILRFPEERMTLEQVATASPVQVTRERIRQKEAKLIQLLLSAFVLGRQRKLGISLRTSFTGFWKRASEWFGAKNEINFPDFLGGLQAAWGVPAELLFPHLPLILTILTSKASIPVALRAQVKLDPGLFLPLSQHLRSVPLHSIPLGEPATDLASHGLTTLGDLWDSFSSGAGPSLHTRSGKNLRKVASLLRACISTDGSIDFFAYAKAMNLEILPEHDPDSAEEFVEALPLIVEKIVRSNDITARAADIFRMRIAVPRASRPTLEQTALALGTYGPSIKREESIMLTALNDQLVDGDFSTAKALLKPTFLGYWQQAADFYVSSHGSFDSFQAQASLRWDIPLSSSGVGAEILWAVLDEYPGGRRAGRKTRRQVAPSSISQPSAPGLIRLRGFRSVH
jgi:hypothetical protein